MRRGRLFLEHGISSQASPASRWAGSAPPRLRAPGKFSRERSLSPSLPLLQVCQGEVRREELPPAYALELLTIFAWEQGCGKEAFSLAQGLRTVLGLICQYQHLCVFWTLNYGFEDPAVRWFLWYQLERPRYLPSPPCPHSPGLGPQEIINDDQ